MGEHASETTPEPVAREARVLLGDLTSGLLWPSLLRAAPLSLRTGRLMLALGAWILILLLGNLNTFWSDKPAFIDAFFELAQRSLGRLGASVFSLDAAGFVASAIELGSIPRVLVEQYPVSTFVLGIPIIAVWVRVGGAISRSAAEEFSLGRVLPWNDAMRFSLRTWPALLGAVLAPLAVVAALALLLAIGGFFFAIPAVHLLPSLIYPVFLLLGAVSVIISILWIIGHPMLVPGVACEGADALDSIQRTFAYVLTRPARFVLYSAILIIQGAIVYGLAAGFIGGVTSFTASSAGAFISDTPREILSPIAPGESVSIQLDPTPSPQITLASFAQDGADAEAPEAEAPEAADTKPSGPIITHGWSRRIVSFWTGALELLLGALLTSFYFTASTLLYLLMRRICDGQDTAELWTPAPDQT